MAERRPDLNFVELRGNMAARLDAASQPGIDAVIAAAAALDRLGWNDRIAERLDPEWFTPQVGQGALALESRLDDVSTRELLATINDEQAALRLTCERAFLAELGAGCSIPAAAYATLDGSLITLRGVMADAEGYRVVRHSAQGTDAQALGRDVARFVRDELGGGSLQSSR